MEKNLECTAERGKVFYVLRCRLPFDGASELSLAECRENTALPRLRPGRLFCRLEKEYRAAPMAADKRCQGAPGTDSDFSMSEKQTKIATIAITLVPSSSACLISVRSGQLKPMHYDSHRTARVQQRVMKVINQLEMSLLHYQGVIRRAQARDAIMKAALEKVEQFRQKGTVLIKP